MGTWSIGNKQLAIGERAKLKAVSNIDMANEWSRDEEKKRVQQALAFRNCILLNPCKLLS